LFKSALFPFLFPFLLINTRLLKIEQ
jgi:hypothetical protein